MTLGRNIYENFTPVRGAALEIARLTSLIYTPQFTGKNSEWGRVAEALLTEEDKFIDIRGFPFSFDVFRRNLIISILRDGELGIVLTELDSEPKLQCIPSHRIGSRYDNNSIVIGGKYDGAKIIDGVIVNDYGTALAYRVYNEAGTAYEDISSNDMLLVFLPDYVEQLRGFSVIGREAFDAFDVGESRVFELISQKVRASFSAAIQNETGTIDPTKAAFIKPSTANNSTTNAANDLPNQVLQPGQIMYFKANQGQKIEFPSNDNPGPNVMAFQEEVLRSFFSGMGWSYDFCHKPGPVGGAPMRVVVDKINASISELEKLILAPTVRRINAWRVAKHIKNKRLKEEVEWYKWSFQGGPEITSDEKYSSDVSIQEMNNLIRAPQDVTERFGGFWEDVQDKAIEYEKRLQERCAAEGVDVNRVKPLTANPQTAPEDGMSENEELKLQMDAYGVGVRAGTLTPTPEDEDYFRKKAGLPALSEAAKAAWKKDKNVRRPITIAGQDGARPGLGGVATQPADE